MYVHVCTMSNRTKLGLGGLKYPRTNVLLLLTQSICRYTYIEYNIVIGGIVDGNEDSFSI